MDDLRDSPLTRRRVLAKLAGLAAAGVGAGAWASAHDEGSALAALQSGAVSCVLAPEQTEGPYYIAGESVRRNITEGRAGTPLALRLSVLDVKTCRPIRNAAIDVWHCDAGGLYSGFSVTDNRTFLRGAQRTNAKGLAVFDTIYPGWYQGRTVHVHIKVHVRGNVVHTGQLYFSDAVTDTVYGAAPYSARPSRTTRNADDVIYRNGGKRSQLALRKTSGGYVGSITMGVHRT